MGERWMLILDLEIYGSIMQLEVIHTLHSFNSLAQEWNDLLACCSASHVPFLRHEYLSTWWRTLGGGEWQHGELYTVLGGMKPACWHRPAFLHLTAMANPP